jgi:hypothetical protein
VGVVVVWKRRAEGEREREKSAERGVREKKKTKATGLQQHNQRLTHSIRV